MHDLQKVGGSDGQPPMQHETAPEKRVWPVKAKMLEHGVEDVDEDILTVEWAVAEGSPGKAIGATGNGVVFVGPVLSLGRTFLHDEC